MRNRLLLSIVLTSGLFLPTGLAQRPSSELQQLFDEHYRWRMREHPESAMQKGDYSNADKTTDGSLAAIERRHAETKQFLDRLRAIDKAGLNQTDRLNYELFELERAREVEGHRFRRFVAPIGGRFGPHQSIPQMHERVRFRDATDYENYLKRLEQVPKRIDDTIELLKLGVQEGRVPPRVCLKGVPAQFEAIRTGGLSPLAEPFGYATANLAEEKRAELRTRFDTAVLPAVQAALIKLGDYAVGEYLPKCRETIAAVDWPEGEAFYAHQLRSMTTTNLTAREIHEIGLREVARIRDEMIAVILKTDYWKKKSAELTGFRDSTPPPDLFKNFVGYLRTDPRFYHKSPEELLTGYREICKRVDAVLPKLFRMLPRLPYGVKEIPAFMAPSQTTAYYSHGDIRNGEPGYFYANTFKLDQRPKYEMIALAMHEAVPGHHLQVALAQEQENVPEFRKDSFITAYGEGWALYSERLGLEVGLYEDPYDNFGRLLYEMWRACRLVVDPGMHALGWSREKAVQFMLDNTALSELNINTEIDRYINWPGQACAYKIGELKIRELRKRAEDQLGARFDLREFHDVILGAGALPLTLLESRVDAWLAVARTIPSR
jgi:uncharacterized protein (DUF885 family)